MTRRTVVVCAAALVLAAGTSAFAQQAGRSTGFKAIYVFGDSLSDGGNLASVGGLNTPPYDPTRYSNGKIWVDYLAEFHRLDPVTPSTSGGTNYAWGGATATPGLEYVPGTNGIAQVQQYLDRAGGVADKKGLYIIEIGLNDLGGLIGGGSDPAAAAAATAGHVETMLSMLLAAGARHLWLVQPSRHTDPLEALLEPFLPGFTVAFESAIQQFNARLASAVAAAEHQDVHVADWDALEDQIRADPGAYGFADTTHACVQEWPLPWWDATLTVCSQPNTYVFWDHSHRTEHVHELYAALLATSLRGGGNH